jgi:hypothetical protein
MAAKDERAEVALARRAALGDEDAFQEIVARYEGRLLAFLIQILRSLAARIFISFAILCWLRGMLIVMLAGLLPAHCVEYA